ncbi:MAG: hypothetical protein Q8Q28_02470 [Pseudomonadota bacterium]|nr:hypothetical protein [Pseudomonadota bacterium]
MDADAYLLLTLAGLTVAAISMQPIIWIAWGIVFAAVCVRIVCLVVGVCRG